MDEKFISQRVTELRLQRNVSEYRMSAELGKSEGYVQAISSGRSYPSVKELYNIVDYFDMTMSEFFDPENHDSPVTCRAIRALRHLRDEDVERLLPVILRLVELSDHTECEKASGERSASA